MADSRSTPLTASPAVGEVNHDDESRMLLGFLHYQRDSVLKIVEGLPEDAWQTPVVSSGWTVAGMLWHLGGVEHHWLQHVTTGVMKEPPAGGEAEDEKGGAYDPEAAFTCDWPSADLIAGYRDECRRSDEVLAVTPLSAAPGGLDFHHDPEYTRQITNVRWIVLHVIEETATHSGHPGDRPRTAGRENQARRTLTRPGTPPPFVKTPRGCPLRECVRREHVTARACTALRYLTRWPMGRPRSTGTSSR
jgi:Protein of unknown function (DUF664)